MSKARLLLYEAKNKYKDFHLDTINKPPCKSQCKIKFEDFMKFTGKAYCEACKTSFAYFTSETQVIWVEL